MGTGESQDAEEEAVDLRVYLAVLARRWKVVVAVTALALVAALLISFTQPTKYRATADLLIQAQPSKSIITDSQSVNVNAAARSLNNEVQLFESESVEKAVEEAYGGPLHPQDVDASVVSDTADLVRATLTSKDADEGAKLVNLYVETFIKVRQTQQVDELLDVGTEIQTKIADLSTRIAQERAPLDDLERRVAANPGNAALAAERDAKAQALSPTLTPLESQRAYFQSQLEQLDLIADITGSGGVRVVRGAEPKGPVSPSPARDAAVALALGLVLGVGIAFLVDTLDERIRTVADLERVAPGVPALALVPAIDQTAPQFLAIRDDPNGAAAEAFRGLRTALKFAAIDHPFRVVQVTSPTAGDGKTTTVANLALALAQGGDRVAVVGCDLRRPRLQERLGVDLRPGFTDVLVGDIELNSAVQRTEANIYVVSAGSHAPNPSELLSTQKAATVIQFLGQQVDIVLLDCTPVLPVTDALVVSRMADATVVVVDSRSTERRALRRTLQQLEQIGAPIVGIVLNGLPEGGDYGYGYGYSYSASSNDKGKRTAPAKARPPAPRRAAKR